MLWPLWILVAGSLVAGWIAYPYFVGEERAAFWGDSLLTLGDPIEAAHHVPAWVKWAPLVAGLLGIAVATLFYLYRTDLPRRLAGALRPLYLFLLNKWYFDELYDRLFVRPALYLGRGLWKAGDGAVIDGIGPDGVAAATRDIARRAGLLQSGYLYHYAFAMLVGVVLLLSWYLLV
jgi:NADH-quinone oxidoreductase subunit L